MALPVDQSRATTNSTTSGTNHSLNLPASIASGDRLLAIIRMPGSTTVTWPAGWTAIETTEGDASDDTTSLALRVADGTEGATISITLGTSRILVGLAYRITGAVDYVVTGAVGSGTQPNSLLWPNPALRTATDILWISIGGCDDSETLTSGPTSYSNATLQASTATGTSGCTVFGASRQLNTTQEDPGAWTLGSTSIWTAYTVGFSDVALPARVTQLPAEALVLPTDVKARATQVALEALVLPTEAKARLTQLPIEVLVENAGAFLPQIVWRT